MRWLKTNEHTVLNETTANGNASPPELEEWRDWGARVYAQKISWEQPDPDHPICGQ
jgi:hypothetical protein